MKKRIITITKAILSALNAEGGMAMFNLLFWGGIGLFGLVNLVVSPYTSDIGLFAGLASTHPKLSIFLLIIGIPSVLMFGMFAYMWGIVEMVYTYRRVMTTCIVYDSAGESITITTNNKKGVIERMKHIIKNILGIIVVLVVGCSDAEHGMRMKALNDDGYPGYCQRDTNHDGWHTLEEGAAVLYKDLGPCPTCKAAGIVPVYNSSTDTTWSVDAQWNKQELAYNTFPYHVCDMSAQEWDSYRLMKWDYAYTIWWRGSLKGLEKLTHTEVREECTSKRMQYELEWRLLDSLEQMLEKKRQRINEVPIEKTWKGASMLPDGVVDSAFLFFMLVVGIPSILALLVVVYSIKQLNWFGPYFESVSNRFTRMRQMWYMVGQGGGLHRYNDTCPMCTKQTQDPTSVVAMLSAAHDRGYDRKEAQAHAAELIDQGISYPVCLDCGQKVALTLCDQSYREEHGFDQELMLEEYKGKCWRYGLKLTLKELFIERKPYWPKA